MEKITSQHPDSQSLNVVNENVEKLKALFPTIVKEGKLDLEELKALLGDYVETNDEYYRFTWAGKAMARQEANKPSTATLRPNKAESKDWDTTENIFIEGDNLEVLKLLQKSYANQVKMIYIDPPYNTGKDFVYKDNYADNLGNYLALTGQTDEEGKKLNTNSETDGRYHSNWLNMMYPRLKLARNLLKDDGVIFISIDDNEVNNLKKLMDEIFGEENFISDITVVNNLKGRNDKKYIATANERLLMYVKTDEFQEYGLSLPDDKIETYNLVDSEGKFRLIELRKRGGSDTRAERQNMYYSLFVNPNDGRVSQVRSDEFYIEAVPKKSNGVDGRWRWGKDTTLIKIKSLLGKPVNGTNKYNIYEKDYLEQDGELKRIKPKSVMAGASYSTDGATKKYRQIMPDIDFTNPKPVELLTDLIQYSCVHDTNAIVLDFFAGSGTTAHAIMQQNADDGGNRKHISIQLPELLSNESQKKLPKFKTIADITKERVRRAGEKIKAEAKEDLFSDGKTLDVGFKAFKLDSSSINAWDGSIGSFEQNLFNSADNIKADRTEEDVLYEVLLKNGLNLTLPIAIQIIADKTVYSVGAGALFICLADGITTNVADGIGKWKEELAPVSCKVIFKDNGFSDVDKTNSIQILRRYGITEVNSI
jgi:adenine-specific DNA-methyltransferase